MTDDEERRESHPRRGPRIPKLELNVTITWSSLAVLAVTTGVVAGIAAAVTWLIGAGR